MAEPNKWDGVNVDDILSFNQHDFEHHIQNIAAWEGEAGGRVAQLRKKSAETKLLLERREAQLRKDIAEKLAHEGGKMTVKEIDAEVVLDPSIIKLEDLLVADTFALDQVDLMLLRPLKTKASMLMLYSGQVRVEKEAWNQSRGRNQS